MKRRVRSFLPAPAVEALRAARAAGASARGALKERSRWREIAATPAAGGAPRVYYGRDAMPDAGDVVHGGAVKFQLLAETFPNASRDFNLLYLGSSSLPVDATTLTALARRRGARFVWNQNGVAYRAWLGDDYARANRVPARLMHEADHVFFQSGFCKLGADRFYGERKGRWEILHNPVDVTRFTPEERRPERPLTLLLGGSQYQKYRVKTALETLAGLPDAHLLVTGALSWSPTAEEETRVLVDRLGVAGRVELVGPYSQRDAPAIIRRADVLLHTKVNDPCPTIVLEAMACGLPVAFAASGGVPELVGDDAGIGVPSPLDWEQDQPPDPGDLARAVRTLAEALPERSAAARERAGAFDSRRWIERHRQVFEELLA